MRLLSLSEASIQPKTSLRKSVKAPKTFLLKTRQQRLPLPQHPALHNDGGDKARRGGPFAEVRVEDVGVDLGIKRLSRNLMRFELKIIGIPRRFHGSLFRLLPLNFRD